jgi:hypothetical protein
MSRRLILASIVGPLSIATSAQAATFIVNKNADDGSANTLRWAIQQSNAAGGSNTILVMPDHRPWVIMLNSSLPPIKGPAVIKGLGVVDAEYTLPPSTEVQVPQPVRVPAEYGRPAVVLDGSNFINTTTYASCPASPPATSGSGPNVRSLLYPALQVVDSGDVEISGFEIRNICIGVMLLRSHDNRVHHNLIHDTLGAAAVLVTGDDGIAGGATTGLSTRNTVEFNVIYDTGDGFECTRGTTNSVYQYNIMYETRNSVAPYSQGIECAGGGDAGISVLYNHIMGYSDGLQPNGVNGYVARGNVIEGTTYGIDPISGTDIHIQQNVIRNNRMGIGVPNTSVETISQNRIYNNGQPLVSLSTSAGGTSNPAAPNLLGIDWGENGVTPNQGAGICTGTQNYPVLTATSSWTGDELALDGTLASCASSYYVVELFASSSLNTAGFAEGEFYLGSVAVATDASGNASFHFRRAWGARDGDDHEGADGRGSRSRPTYFTATATSQAGATSEFSAPILLNETQTDAGRDH